MTEQADATDSPRPAPQLPPPKPEPVQETAGADVPFLPAAAPPSSSSAAAPAAAFDPKDVADSTTRANAVPVYGTLPVANPDGRAGADALREQARKKRRRNTAVSWGVVAVFMGGIGAAGWFAYTTYQKDQDQQAADREIVDARGPSEMLETIDELSGGAAPSAGGLLDAVDAASDAMSQADTEVAGPRPTAPPAVVPSRIGWAEVGLTQFGYRRYEGAAIDSPNDSYAFVYDVPTDDYAFVLVTTGSDEGPAGKLYGTATGEWMSLTNVNGESFRWGRSADSADPSPDLPQVGYLDERAPLPVDARRFATPADVGPILSGESSNGPTYDVRSFYLDVTAYRDASPDSYAGWLTTWTAPGPKEESFYDKTRRQFTDDTLTGLDLASFRAPGLYFANGEPELTDQALVAFSVTPENIVNLVLIVDPVSDFRVEYVLGATSPDAEVLINQLDELEWIDSE